MSVLLALLLLAPDRPDEAEALSEVMQAALARIAPSVVTIETVGGVRQVHLPDELKEKMTVPERPREGDPDAPKPDGDEENDGGESPEGRTPRYKDEWRKMLALPGFKKAEGPTTGLVVSADGHVVTSAWNFDSKPNVVTVTTADGKTHAARLLGVDRAAGLALVKIDAEGLPVPRFLDPKQARLGAWAFAVGRAVNRHHPDVKYGIVSARNRIDGNALQTDAATNPTNYGGPLIDAEGAVYGVIVPLGARGEEANPNWYDAGIGFAVPVDPVKIVERLGKEGVELRPAYLGVVTEEDRTEPGARITEVVPGQPAAKAGLQKDDVVERVGDVAVGNAFTLRFEVGRRRAGDTVKLTVRRADETVEVVVTLAERPEERGDDERLPVPMPGEPKKGKKDE